MKFKSDKQRKAVFASMNKPTSNNDKFQDRMKKSREHKNEMIVTKDDWRVNMTSGGNIPSGKVMLQVYSYDKDGNQINAKEDGKIMTREEAKKLCLEKGYTQKYSEIENEK